MFLIRYGTYTGEEFIEVNFLLASKYLSELGSDIFRMNQIRIGYSQEPKRIRRIADVTVLEWDLGLVIQEINTKRYVPKSIMLQLKKKLKKRDVF